MLDRLCWTSWTSSSESTPGDSPRRKGTRLGSVCLVKKGGKKGKGHVCFYFTLCPTPQSPSCVQMCGQMLIIHLIMKNPVKRCSPLPQGGLYIVKIVLFLFFFHLLLNFPCFLLCLRAQQVPGLRAGMRSPPGAHPKPCGGEAACHHLHSSLERCLSQQRSKTHFSSKRSGCVGKSPPHLQLILYSIPSPLSPLSISLIYAPVSPSASPPTQKREKKKTIKRRVPFGITVSFASCHLSPLY